MKMGTYGTNLKYEFLETYFQHFSVILTLTMDSFVWAISDITPSVTMRRTKYWEPSFTEAAYLREEKPTS